MWSLNVRKSSLRPLITLVSWLRFWNLKWQTLIYLSLTGWSNSQAHERATYLTSSSTPQPFSQSAITATDVFTYCFVPWAHGGYNQPNAYYNLGKKRCRGTRCCWDPNVLYPPNCVISGLSFESFQSFYHSIHYKSFGCIVQGKSCPQKRWRGWSCLPSGYLTSGQPCMVMLQRSKGLKHSQLSLS